MNLGGITMDLKKLFPLSYKKSLVVSLIVYIIAAIVMGAIIGLAGWMTGWIPVAGTVIGWLLRGISILAELYVLGGIVVSILLALKVIK